MVTCLHLDCTLEATHKLTPQYGACSWWCRTHGHAAFEVEQRFSNRQSSGPRLSPQVGLTMPRLGIPREDAAS